MGTDHDDANAAPANPSVPAEPSQPAEGPEQKILRLAKLKHEQNKKKPGLKAKLLEKLKKLTDEDPNIYPLW